MNTTNDITNAPGIRQVLETVSSDLEVMDDIEGEQESCGVSNEHNGNTQMDLNASDDVEEVLANISEASRGVKEGTDAAYKRIMSAFNDFLVEESIIQPGTNIFTLQKLDPNIDYYIVGFIMKRCDDIDMHGISRGPNNAERGYSNAQKLRAGTTYGFRKTGRRGKVPWNRATAQGNPSISDLVSSYMLGLHKRKVCFETCR